MGRRSSRIPARFDRSRLSCADAWRRMVDLAVENRVDLVAVAGDLIDRDNRYFEAFGPLVRGLARLAEAGIETWAVAGNHDHEVLGAFAGSSAAGGFRLLGQSGRWEQAVFHSPTGGALQVLGWSFPRERFPDDPLEGLTPSLAPDLPTLGLLHTDLDQSGSPYAASTTAGLSSLPLDLWLIGHAHRPLRIDRETGPVILNPGSPQAMDPGETGPHGVWLAELLPGLRPRMEYAPLSTVRYDSLTVNLEGVETEEALRARIISDLRTHLARAEADDDVLEVLSCRLRLTGRTRLHRLLGAMLAPMRQDLELPGVRAEALVEDLALETRPAADLETLAGSSGPPATLARLLINLEKDTLSSDDERLIERVRDKMAEINGSKPYAALPALEADPGAARLVLLRQGLLLLDALLAQKEEGA